MEIYTQHIQQLNLSKNSKENTSAEYIALTATNYYLKAKIQ